MTSAVHGSSEAGEHVDPPGGFSGDGKGFDEFLACDVSSFPFSGPVSGSKTSAMVAPASPSHRDEANAKASLLAKAKATLAPFMPQTITRESWDLSTRTSQSVSPRGWDSVPTPKFSSGPATSPEKKTAPILQVEEGFRFSSVFQDPAVLRVEGGMKFSSFFPSGESNPSGTQAFSSFHCMPAADPGKLASFREQLNKLGRPSSGDSLPGSGSLAQGQSGEETSMPASVPYHATSAAGALGQREPSFSHGIPNAGNQPAAPAHSWNSQLVFKHQHEEQQHYQQQHNQQQHQYHHQQLHQQQGQYQQQGPHDGHPAPQTMFVSHQGQALNQEQYLQHQPQAPALASHACSSLPFPSATSAFQPLAPPTPSGQAAGTENCGAPEYAMAHAGQRSSQGAGFLQVQHQDQTMPSTLPSCHSSDPHGSFSQQGAASAGQPRQLEERLRSVVADLDSKGKGHAVAPTSAATGLSCLVPVPAGCCSMSPSSSSEEGRARVQGHGFQAPLVAYEAPYTAATAYPDSPYSCPSTSPASPVLSHPASPLSAGASGGCITGKKRGWAAKCAKDPLKYFDDQFCKACKRLRRTSPEIRNMLVQLSAEAKEHRQMHGGGAPSSLEELLPGRCSCGLTSSRKEAGAGSAVLLQIVQLHGSASYEPKMDGNAWRKYGDKSVSPSKMQAAEVNLARGRLYYKCTKCSKAPDASLDAATARAAKKMVQPVHSAPGLFLLRYEGLHTHDKPETDGVQRPVGHLEGVLWEMDLSFAAGADGRQYIEEIEKSFFEACKPVLGATTDDVLAYVKAALAGVPSLRKHMLSKGSEHGLGI